MSIAPPEGPQQTPDPALLTPDPVVLVRLDAINGLVEKAAEFRRRIEDSGENSDRLIDMLKDGIVLDVLVIPGTPSITILMMPDNLIAFRQDLTAYQFIRAEQARDQDEAA